MLRLPYDLILVILAFLRPDDVLSVCSTCTTLREFVKDRSVWHGAISDILVDLPLLPLCHRIDSLPAEELRKNALSASRLEHAWHQEDLVPRCQQSVWIDPRAHSAKVLPGGEWLIVVARDVSLRLIKIEDPKQAVVIPLDAGNPRLVLRVVTQLFYSSSHETLLLVRTTSSIRTNFLCLYLIDTDGPSINLLTTIPAVDTICASCVGGNLVAYETRPGWGNMNVEPGLFHVRNVTTSSADPVVQATFSVGNTLDTAADAICILSSTRLLLARALSLAIYDIPDLKPLTGPNPAEINHITPIWSRAFDSGGIEVGPILWEPRASTPASAMTSMVSDAAHQRAVVFLGVDRIHVVCPPAGDARATWTCALAPAHRAFDIPEIITSSAGAVGFARALWTKHERTKDGPLKLTTCTLPRVVPRDVADGTAMVLEETPMKLGSLAIPAGPMEWVVDLSFDEGSGRICAFIGDRWNGPRRVVLLDVV